MADRLVLAIGVGVADGHTRHVRIEVEVLGPTSVDGGGCLDAVPGDQLTFGGGDGDRHGVTAGVDLAAVQRGADLSVRWAGVGDHGIGTPDHRGQSECDEFL